MTPARVISPCLEGGHVSDNRLCETKSVRSTGVDNEGISQRDGGGGFAGRLHQQLKPPSAAENDGGRASGEHHDGGLPERQSAAV
jgi:hypothetical protein